MFPNKEPLARKDDESTSHKAGEKLTRSGKRDSQKSRLYSWLKLQSIAYTAHEIAKLSGFKHPMVHKRLPDLMHDGYVEKRPKRICRVSKELAVTWVARRDPRQTTFL